MECISELKDSLNAYFSWNKARMACFVNMLLALLATRTVNLSKLAYVIFGEAQQASRYRRIQRYGLDFLCDSIVRLAYKPIHFQQALKILSPMSLSHASS